MPFTPSPKQTVVLRKPDAEAENAHAVTQGCASARETLSEVPAAAECPHTDPHNAANRLQNPTNPPLNPMRAPSVLRMIQMPEGSPLRLLAITFVRLLVTAGIFIIAAKALDAGAGRVTKYVKARIAAVIKPGLLIVAPMGSLPDTLVAASEEEVDEDDEEDRTGEELEAPGSMPILTIGFEDAAEASFDFTGTTSSRVVLAMRERELQVKDRLINRKYASLYDLAAELYAERLYDSELELLESYASDPPTGKLSREGRDNFLVYVDDHYIQPSVVCYAKGQIEQASWLAKRAARLIRALRPSPVASSVTVDARVNSALLLEALLHSPVRALTHQRHMKTYLKFMQGSGMLGGDLIDEKDNVVVDDTPASENEDRPPLVLDPYPIKQSVPEEKPIVAAVPPHRSYREVVLQNDPDVVKELQSLKEDDTIGPVQQYFLGVHAVQARKFAVAYDHFAKALAQNASGPVAELARLGHARCLFWGVRSAQLGGDASDAAEFERLRLGVQGDRLITSTAETLRQVAAAITTPSYRDDVDYYISELEKLGNAAP